MRFSGANIVQISLRAEGPACEFQEIRCQTKHRFKTQELANKGKGKVVPVLNWIKHYAMKAYGGVDV
jgi:hypothetical protein